VYNIRLLDAGLDRRRCGGRDTPMKVVA
jgi:hypothetical protein